MNDDSRITSEHLSRAAWVFVRQSTPGQVRNHPESRQRQYRLMERARELGWRRIETVDDYLGRSGDGVTRPGFDRLPAAICRKEVGLILSVAASRLARNGRDWHTLLEYCGLVGCLVSDGDGIYDPRVANDRLFPGMRGTIS